MNNRKTIHRYNNIFLLGENCELAWQFTRKVGELDSGLFNWVRVVNKTEYLKALKHPKRILNSENVVIVKWGMVYNFKSGCLFHLSLTTPDLFDENMEFHENAWDIECENLYNRTKHLIEKFKTVLKDKNKKLFIYKAHKLNNDYVSIRQHYKFFCKIYNILAKKTENFDFLIIVKEDAAKFLPTFNQPNIYIRTLKKFTPIPDAVNINLTDDKGWTKIFREFTLKERRKSTKKYKFNRN